jgi:hypothetical protein
MAGEQISDPRWLLNGGAPIASAEDRYPSVDFVTRSSSANPLMVVCYRAHGVLNSQRNPLMVRRMFG